MGKLHEIIFFKLIIQHYKQYTCYTICSQPQHLFQTTKGFKSHEYIAQKMGKVFLTFIRTVYHSMKSSTSRNKTHPKTLLLNTDLVSACTCLENFIIHDVTKGMQLNYFQWRIQDFPEVGAPTLGGGGRQHMNLPNFPKNYIKMKEFGPR